MRVLLVANVLVPPHMAVWQALVKAGVDLAIVGTTSSFGNPMYAPGPYAAPTGVRTHFVRPFGRRSAGHQQWVYPSLGRIVASEKPDLVHVISEPWGLLAAQVARLGSRFVVHGSTDIAPNRRSPRGRIKRAVAASVLRRASGFAAPNHGAIVQAQSAGLPLSVPTLRAQHLVPNPEPFILASRRRPALRKEYGWGESEVVIGFAGRLAREKGVHWLFDSLVDTSCTARVVVAGWGPEEEYLRERTRQMPLPVKLLGRLDSDRTANFFACVDLLVVPSLETPTWKEYFGRVAVEAMLAKTALIVSDSGYLPDVVAPTVPVVPMGDSQTLKSTIERLVAQPHLRQEIAEAGFRHARRFYTPDGVARELAALWEKIL